MTRAQFNHHHYHHPD
nr:his operon leader peptide [Citrobacter sp. FDAARGOS_156]